MQGKRYFEPADRRARLLRTFIASLESFWFENHEIILIATRRTTAPLCLDRNVYAGFHKVVNDVPDERFGEIALFRLCRFLV